MDFALFVTSAVFSRYLCCGSFPDPTAETTSNETTKSTTTTTIKDDDKPATTATSTTTTTAAPSSSTAPITLDLLQRQNAETSTAIIDYYSSNNPSASSSSTTPATLWFQQLATYEGDLTKRRDDEDGHKLQLGIEFAQQKGVIDPAYVPEPYVSIDVLGKTPDQVAQQILTHVSTNSSSTTTADNSSNSTKQDGLILVLVGLSGTGKGTTVERLRQLLEEQGHTVTTWSNGNVFRAVTLLATTWWEQQQQQNPNDGTAVPPLDEKIALTKENLTTFMQMLSFEKNPATGSFDTHIQGLGFDVWVEQIQNTTLKSPTVSKNIPTIAQYTQGEVIMFAAAAIAILQQAGIDVLVEGREQTVNYVRTPHRFQLLLSDETLIGKRRAAQRVAAQTLLNYQKQEAQQETTGTLDLPTIMDQALQVMVQETVH